MTPADMEGLTFGPVTHLADGERIAALVEATTDTPHRWTGIAPPAYGAVLLFRVAGGFLWDPRLSAFVRTLIHVEQTFTYPSPIYEGDRVVIAGTVDRVRERSGSYFATFTATASVGDRPVLVSESLFLMSDRAAAEPGPDHGEPAAEERTINEEPGKRPLPSVGAEDTIARSASRADLVRYAAATADFNPLHWDHDAARAAGLDGVVVHGLLLNAWLTQHAAAFTVDDAPVVTTKARFRSALGAGAAATTTARLKSVPDEAAELSLQLTSGEATIVTAEAVIRGVVTAEAVIRGVTP